MIDITLKELINKYPYEILFKEIVAFESFDERLSVIDCIVANTIGVSERSIEFITDNNPPLKDEILCWIWAFRPDLSKEILEITENEDMKFALSSYVNNTMYEFWDSMSDNYIQYLSGYSKENIAFSDIEKTILEIQESDDEHGVFWVSVITDDENVIETDKFLNLAIVFDGNQMYYEAKNWLEVKELYKLLLEENFEAIKQKIE